MPEVRDLMLQVRDEEYRDKVSTAPAVQAEVLPSPNKIQSKFARFFRLDMGLAIWFLQKTWIIFVKEDPIPRVSASLSTG